MSSKINLQTCEYACKSSIFQDNQLILDKSEHELLLDLAAKSRNTVSADLPDYIMEKDIVRAALRVAKEVDATDEEWQTFMKMLKERKR